jgi:hypothetical protein
VSWAIDSKLKTYRRVEKEFLTGTDRGGSFVVYLAKREPRRIDVEVLVSRADHIRTFYFIRRQLVMVAGIEGDYQWDDKKGEVDFSKYLSVSRRRYYFEHGRMTAWREAGSRTMHDTRDQEFRETERTLLEEARKYHVLAMSKRRTLNVEEWIQEGH